MRSFYPDKTLQMHLIPVSIEIIKNESDVKSSRKVVDLTLCVEVRGSGDFSDYVTDGSIDAQKIAVAILEGKLIISRDKA